MKANNQSIRKVISNIIIMIILIPALLVFTEGNFFFNFFGLAYMLCLYLLTKYNPWCRRMFLRLYKEVR